ncbi:MAG: MarR family transcriptional regulator [Pseudomonadales bacterium]|nr:MarR family transcriptional regulator [Pseudomonadales bacterium]MCP5183548.1 MarR family transcriptional regulator [Pseudomonadales bacterium]
MASTARNTPRVRGARKRADPSASDFLLANSPFYLMAQTNGRYMLAMERSLKAVGMDLPRWRVLMVLHEKSPSTVSEIASRSAMKLSTMTKVAQRLAREGFVELSANRQDARSTDVHLTAKGAEAVTTIRLAASRVFQRATGEFSDADIATLNHLLLRLDAGLQEL